MTDRGRRDFLQGSLALASLGLLSGCGLPSIPSPQSGELYRVGVLQPSTQASTGGAPTLEAFRQSLREHGYIEGQNVVLEVRYSDGQDERLPELAAELVGLHVGVIVTGGGAARALGLTIPQSMQQQATEVIQ